MKDTKGQPVKAIGSGTVTDKFFEEVKVDGSDLYIKLLGGEELRIPIVSDFFCRIITPTEGVQTFDAGATKRFVVEIRGVEQVKLSAPEGWTARLTDAVDERAELIVTSRPLRPAGFRRWPKSRSRAPERLPPLRRLR